VLAIAIFCVCFILLLPRSDLGIGKTLAFFLFGPGFSGPHGTETPRIDILQFVDPLIGTANGGMLLSSPSCRRCLPS